MKPAWDQLVKDHAGSTVLVVADVDCIGAGAALCESKSKRITSYPTLLWGETSNLTEYQGGRDYKTLSNFVKESGLACGPEKLELCDRASRAEFESLLQMSNISLQSGIEQAEKQITDATRKLKSLTVVMAKRQKDAGLLKDSKPPRSEEVQDHSPRQNFPPETSKQPDVNPILYLRHFAVYVLLPLVAMVWLAILMLPIIFRRNAKTDVKTD